MNRNNKPLGPMILLSLMALLTMLFVAGAANTAPVGAFAAWKSPDGVETEVLLDASASSDVDGSIVTYQWVFGDGTTGSGQTNTHLYPGVSRYDVLLLVTDDAGASHLLARTIDLATLSALPASEEPSESVAFPPVAPPTNVPIGTEEGELAPPFSLPNFSDQIVSLSGFLGRPVLIEFWRSTCPGCIASLPHLEQLRQAFEERGLVIVLIIMDWNPAEGMRFLTQNGYTQFVTLRDMSSDPRQTPRTYGINVTPHTFLLDRQGVIRFEGHPNNVTESLVAAWL